MKHAIFFVLLLLICIDLFSQDSLCQAKNELWAVYPQEQLYLQTSKDIYESGEDLWFKVYHLDAYSFGRSIASKTLTVNELWVDMTRNRLYITEPITDDIFYCDLDTILKDIKD